MLEIFFRRWKAEKQGRILFSLKASSHQIVWFGDPTPTYIMKA